MNIERCQRHQMFIVNTCWCGFDPVGVAYSNWKYSINMQILRICGIQMLSDLCLIQEILEMPVLPAFSV